MEKVRKAKVFLLLGTAMFLGSFGLMAGAAIAESGFALLLNLAGIPMFFISIPLVSCNASDLVRFYETGRIY